MLNRNEELDVADSTTILTTAPVTFKNIMDVPEAIREFYNVSTNGLVVELPRPTQVVTWEKVKDIILLHKGNNPKAVSLFIELAKERDGWEFHDNYRTWLEKDPTGDVSNLQWQAEEPNRDTTDYGLLLSSEANLKIEQSWVSSELSKADIQVNFHLDGDDRVTYSLDSWRTYRKDLRNYIKDGVVVGTRPIIGGI